MHPISLVLGRTMVVALGFLAATASAQASSVDLYALFANTSNPNVTVTDAAGTALSKVYNGDFTHGYTFSSNGSIGMLAPASPSDFTKLQYWNVMTNPSGNWYLSANYSLPYTAPNVPSAVDVSIVVGDSSSWIVIDHFQIAPGANFTRSSYLGNWPDQNGFNIAIQISTKGANNWYQTIYVGTPSIQPVTGIYTPAAPNLVVDVNTKQVAMQGPSPLPAVTENPPALLSTGAQGAWTNVYYSTAYAYGCATPGNPFQAPVHLSSAYCGNVTLPQYQSAPHVQIPPPVNASNPWMLNYDGIFSAFAVWDSGQQYYWVLTVNHSETKNEMINGALYQNPFSPSSATTCASGYGSYVNGQWTPSSTYQDCFQAYDAFVSTEWNYYNASNNYGRNMDHPDRGPVTWPTDGYYNASGNKTSQGVRHPSAIIYNGNIYIFYQDTSTSIQNGLPSYGIKVAQGSLANGGVAGSFSVWNGTDWSTPALPSGFNLANLANFMTQKGPAVPSLFAAEAQQGSTLNTLHFSVAYDPNRQIFTGVEEYIDNSGNVNTRVRLSVDLVHWSPPTNLSVTGSGTTWGNSLLNYPEFANASFTSNTVADTSNLYVLGTSTSGGLYYTSFHLY